MVFNKYYNHAFKNLFLKQREKGTEKEMIPLLHNTEFSGGKCASDTRRLQAQDLVKGIL